MLNHSQPTKLPETQHHYSHHISTDFETVNREVTTRWPKKKVSIIRNLCFSVLSHLILQFLAVLSPNNGENSWEKNIQRSHWGLLSPAPLEHLSHSVITFSYSIPSLLAVSLDYKLLRKGYVCLSSLYILSTQNNPWYTVDIQHFFKE